MKFESKYLIRWGIPGWIFIFWLGYTYVYLANINLLNVQIQDLSKSLALLVSLTALGVPIGYVFHQISFGLLWVDNNNKDYGSIADKIGDKFPKHYTWGDDHHEDYFQLEYVWHMVLLKQDAKTRAYIEGRYAHLLRTAHGLGALSVSFACSNLFTVLLWLLYDDLLKGTFYMVAASIIQSTLFASAFLNYKYFSKNLQAFQIKILKTYL